MSYATKQSLLASCLLVAAILITYWGVADVPFLFDDQPNITERDALHITELNLDSLKGAAEGALLKQRVIPNISFAIDWWRGKGSPRPFQWTNLFIHLINSLLVFFLLKNLLTHVDRLHSEQNRSHDSSRLIQPVIYWSLLGALLWALHPIQVQSVAYVVQRMASLAALFTLLSVLSYLQARLAALNSLKRGFWFALAILSALAGAYSKENAWVIPALWWLVEFGIVRHRRLLVKNRVDQLIFTLPFIMFFLVVIDLITGNGPVSRLIASGYVYRDFTLEERLLTQPRVILYHISQLLWPAPGRFAIEHDFTTSVSLLNPATTLPALFAVMVWTLGGLWCLLQRNLRIIGFALIWLPLTLAIESSIVALEMVFEHRFYLPLFGLITLLLIAGLGSRNRPGFVPYRSLIGGILIFTVVCAICTQQRIHIWSDDLEFNRINVMHAPESSRAWNYLSISYRRRQDWPRAIEAVNKAASLPSKHPDILINRAQIRYLTKSDLNLSLADLNLVIQRFPTHFSGYFNRGIIYAALGQMNQAIEDYTKSLQLRPRFTMALNNRALVHIRMGDLGSAINDLSKAIEINPYEGEFYANRGTAHLMRNRLKLAESDLETAHQLGSKHARLYTNLARTLQMLGKVERSSHFWSLACQAGSSIACSRVKRP